MNQKSLSHSILTLLWFSGNSWNWRLVASTFSSFNLGTFILTAFLLKLFNLKQRKALLPGQGEIDGEISSSLYEKYITLKQILIWNSNRLGECCTHTSCPGWECSMSSFSSLTLLYAKKGLYWVSLKVIREHSPVANGLVKAYILFVFWKHCWNTKTPSGGKVKQSTCKYKNWFIVTAGHI